MNALPLDPHVLIHAMKETSTSDLFEEVVLFFFQRKLQVGQMLHYLDHANPLLLLQHECC